MRGSPPFFRSVYEGVHLQVPYQRQEGNPPVLTIRTGDSKYSQPHGGSGPSLRPQGVVLHGTHKETPGTYQEEGEDDAPRDPYGNEVFMNERVREVEVPSFRGPLGEGHPELLTLNPRQDWTSSRRSGGVTR